MQRTWEANARPVMSSIGSDERSSLEAGSSDHSSSRPLKLASDLTIKPYGAIITPKGASLRGGFWWPVRTGARSRAS